MNPGRYLVFYKPFGVLCQFRPDADHRHPTLADYIPVREVYPAGRLDHDSEGLVLLTNDGRLQHALTDPRFGHPRTYWVQVEREPGEEALAALRAGVMIQGRATLPAEIHRIGEPDLPPREPPVRFRKNVPTGWLAITLKEGRNRQVRRMTAAVGHPTLRLVRAAIGPLRLAGLAPGEWRELTTVERKLLLDSTAAASRHRTRGTR